MDKISNRITIGPSRHGGRASEQGDRTLGGRVHCSTGSPGQTSCRQTSIGFVSWYKLSMMPCQAQRTSMSGGRVRHLLAFFALEEAL